MPIDYGNKEITLADLLSLACGRNVDLIIGVYVVHLKLNDSDINNLKNTFKMKEVKDD